MKRSAWLALVVCAALLAPRGADSRQYYGFTVGIANAPRPPLIRVAREPHTLLSGDAMVYVVDDAAVRFDGDLFHYGQYWFAYTRGYWYRARSHRGPYAVIDVLKVPRAIIGVPRPLWKHHPLAQAPGKAVKANAAAFAKPRARPMPRGEARASNAAPGSATSARATPGTRRTRQGSAR